MPGSRRETAATLAQNRRSSFATHRLEAVCGLEHQLFDHHRTYAVLRPLRAGFPFPCCNCLVSSKGPGFPLPLSYTPVMAIPSTFGHLTPDLSEILNRLGLNSYAGILSEHGFYDWATVVDITEDDFSTLKFKLGHRRALQREIATFRGIPRTLSLNCEKSSSAPISLSTSALETLTRQTSNPPSSEKRRYRRHPRPDPSAPKKPKTACTMS